MTSKSPSKVTITKFSFQDCLHSDFHTIWKSGCPATSSGFSLPALGKASRFLLSAQESQMQAQLEQQRFCSLAPSSVDQAQSCLTGSCEHAIWLTLYSLFPCKIFPFTILIPSQINSSFPCTISSSTLLLLILYP